MNKKKLVPKCQYGTNRGGLVHHDRITPGTWGNRGQGNELESALENGLSTIWTGVKWIGDKVLNAGDYFDRGLAYVTGLIPGGETAEEALENKKHEQNPQYESYTSVSSGKTYSTPYWVDVKGENHYYPQIGIPPQLPSLPTNAPGSMIAIHNKMKKLIQSWKVGERRYQALGMADAMANSKTAQRLNQLIQEFNEGLKAMGKSIKKADDVKLYGKAEAAYKHTKAMATDMRSVNAGRPATKKYLREIEDMLYKDQSPVAKKMYEQLRLKRAKISDPVALKSAEEKIFREYATKRNLTHHLSKLGWIE